jgi:cysteinyl-tRNA synthetase
MSTIRLYNTLTRAKEPITPLDGKTVKLYTCGPTVYHYAHIGNLRTYIFEDILTRTLRKQFPVLHVMNITDVGHLTSDSDEGEDKMEKGAAREGKSVWDVAKFYTDAFQKDIALLGIRSPDIWCKATDHIKEQIQQIQQLERNGFTYVIEDGVYFDTAKLDDYGKLAKLDIEGLKAGARIEMAEGKRNPTDFALWKFSPKTDAKRAMEWDSPWGVGFPGWHIECSAMSMKYLGEQFDIHCGGIDHINVHHTNEIAQAEGATGKKPWVTVWMHGEFLVMDKGKMSKSSGDFLTLQVLIDKGYDPLVYRYFCLTASYRQQLSFSFEALDTAKSGYQSLKNKVRDLHERRAEGNDAPHPDAHGKTHALREQFLDAINDDLNMPQALAATWAVLRDDTLTNSQKLALAEEFDTVLGLALLDLHEEIPAEILTLAKERDQARAAKDWAASDRLRDAIKAQGFIVEDSKDGTRVRKG